MGGKRILGGSHTSHDNSWYDGEMHYIAERYSRIKSNAIRGEHRDEMFFDEVIQPKIKDFDVHAATIPYNERFYQWSELISHYKSCCMGNFLPKKLFDCYYNINFFYVDHHQSHAAYAYLMSGFEECDIIAYDGGAAHFETVWIDKNQNIKDLTPQYLIGKAWNVACGATGFGGPQGDGGAGKVMGLAGFGKVHDGLLKKFYELMTSDLDIEYHTNLAKGKENEELAEDYIKSYVRKHRIMTADVAATVQYLSERVLIKIVEENKTSDNICVSGGVAYNGYMNELLTKYYDNVFVPPAVGDEGQSIGAYMIADYVLNNNVHVPPVYAGAKHPVNEEIFKDMKYKKMPMDEIYPYIAKEIANGAIVGWFQGRSESGNRALGNRSILADPRNPNIKDTINSKVKLREDFRPFAPSVLVEDYQEYFDTNQPSPYMSRIMPVKEDKRSVIPGVTHVDGTARIQTVEKSFNEKYWNLINAFKQETGVPMLLNTSFNCQEPIVETPEDALKTFKRPEVGLDILVIEDYVVLK